MVRPDKSISIYRRPGWLIALGILPLAALITSIFLGMRVSIVISLLLLQCLISVGLALIEPRTPETRHLKVKTILGIAAALATVIVTGWLWWEQLRDYEATNEILRSHSEMQRDILSEAKKTLGIIDSSSMQLAKLERAQAILASQANQLSIEIERSASIQDSLYRATQTQLQQIKKFQFPIHIEKVSWLENVKGDASKTLFRYICECYPHDVSLGSAWALPQPEKGIPPVRFWYEVVTDSVTGINLKLEDKIQIPKGSDLMKYLYLCKSEDMVLKRALLAKYYNLFGGTMDIFELDSGKAASEQMKSRAMAYRDSLMAKKFDDSSWLVSAAEEQRLSELLLLRKEVEKYSLSIDTVKMRELLKSYYKNRKEVEPYTIPDSMLFAKNILLNWIKTINSQIQHSLPDDRKDRESRMAAARFGIPHTGLGGVRWFSIFATLPDTLIERNLYTDSDFENAFLGGDFSFVVEVPNFQLFGFEDQTYSNAKLFGEDTLISRFYADFAEIRWPVTMGIDYSNGEGYSYFSDTARIIHNSGRVASICDLNGSWLCIPWWQLPVPDEIEITFAEGKTIKFLGNEFKEGPYGWYWLQITEKHLTAFPGCEKVH